MKKYSRLAACLLAIFMLAQPAALAAAGASDAALAAGRYNRGKQQSYNSGKSSNKNSKNKYSGQGWQQNYQGYQGVHTWSEDEFSAAVAFGLVPQGFDALDMDEPVTRQEFCQIALLLYHLFDSATAGSRDITFADCDDPLVAEAYTLGIVSGYSDGSFHPDASISRQELVRMLYNVLTSLGRSPQVSDAFAAQALKPFGDCGDLQPWAIKPVCVMLDADITNGVSATALAPLGTATRQQAVVMAYRFSRAVIRGDFDDMSLDYSKKSAAFSSSDRREARNRQNALYEEKYIAIFGSLDTPLYTSHAQAVANMVTITVPVWNLNSSGAKVSSTRSLQVHKNIAQTIALIFDEIYNGAEQFPIHSVGGYAWRSNETSEHRWGLAIDINANENYMIKPDGTIVAGSFWAPGENPYSIPEGGDVVTAFQNHGFTWGGTAWKSSNDYMHFSYFGG